jgi:hypothetical protein
MTSVAGIVVNQDSADVDFRVESNNGAHMLFVDGGNDRVGVYTSSPEGRFDTQGTGYFGFQNYSTQATQLALVLRGEPVSGVYAQSRFNFYTQPGTTDNGIARMHIKSQYGGDAESSELFTFTSNGKLGIGTALPSTFLHIQQGAGTTPTLSTGTRFVIQRNTFGGDPNGIAIIAGNNTTDGAFIDFGISTDADIGKIKYDTQNNTFQFYANAIERFRIEPTEVVVNDPSNDVDFRVESNGNTHMLFVDGGNDAVLFGTTSTDPVSGNVAGASIKAQGNIQASRDDGVVISGNRKSTDGDIFELRKDGTAVGTIGASGGDLIIGTGDTYVRFSDGVDTLLPVTNTGADRDNAMDLGYSSVRFDDIYATNGTIQTSDQNEKNTITDSDLGLDFVNRLTPKSYIFNGKTRTHYGLIAQEVETVLSDISKTSTDFAGFIKSDISEEQDGSEYRYGLRYNEFIAPMIKAIQELKADNDALRARIETLENA